MNFSFLLRGDQPGQHDASLGKLRMIHVYPAHMWLEPGFLWGNAVYIK